jgi:hypothetical protein
MGFPSSPKYLIEMVLSIDKALISIKSFSFNCEPGAPFIINPFFLYPTVGFKVSTITSISNSIYPCSY